ncbi:hypothetical protein E3N88_05171 [Mikania micrantha]|uniref:Uncharacterized protein n=1 Tax=Mikania micrantha TaxID=192012 RepID=A0A5N6PXF6_9ASTR|nr:hypothetical protein E3N88_05171 [Mikania micrantha]
MAKNGLLRQHSFRMPAKNNQTNSTQTLNSASSSTRSSSLRYPPNPDLSDFPATLFAIAHDNPSPAAAVGPPEKQEDADSDEEEEDDDDA